MITESYVLITCKPLKKKVITPPINRNSDTVLSDIYLYVCHKAKHKMSIKINKILTFSRYFKFTRIFASKKCNSSDDFGVGTLKLIS